jgi:hypothetical protein
MSKEFNQGVSILINRMESNPDEFLCHSKLILNKRGSQPSPDDYRWQSIVSAIESYTSVGHISEDIIVKPELEVKLRDAWLFPFLSTQEIDALCNKYYSILRKHFTEQVVEAVVRGNEVKEEPYDGTVSSAQMGLFGNAQNSFGQQVNAQNSFGQQVLIGNHISDGAGKVCGPKRQATVTTVAVPDTLVFGAVPEETKEEGLIEKLRNAVTKK